MVNGDSPAQLALVADTQSGSSSVHDDGDAPKAATDPTGRTNTTSSTVDTSRSNSLKILSSNASATTAGASPCDPLAAGPATSVPIPVYEHPLSPDVSLSSVNRSSYFRSAVLTGVSPVSNVIFPEDDEEETPDANDVNKQTVAQNGLQADHHTLSASPSAIDTTPLASIIPLPILLRLPQAPHHLSAEAVEERLREASSSDLRGIHLAQELSRQLETVQKELAELKTVQQAREQALNTLLREGGNVSDSLINRTLVRANVEGREASAVNEPGIHGWKITLGGSPPRLAEQRDNNNPPKRVSQIDVY